MASFFKKQSDKDKKEKSGQSPQSEGGAGKNTQPPLTSPPSKTKSDMYDKNGPEKPKTVQQGQEKPPKPPREKKVKAPREKKPRPPKGPKKPLFSFGKKKTAEKLPPSGVSAAGEVSPPVTEKEGKKGRPDKKGAKKPRTKKSKSGGGGFGGSKMSPVGLDLGSSSITAVRLRHQTGGSMLLQAGIDSLPEGLIHEGEVKDVEALAFAIKDFWKTHKIKSRKVALGLANQKVVVRTLEFPMLDEKELRSAIEFQAQDYIPIPVEDAVFDFHVMGRITDEEGVEKQKVLVVAAQKDMVMDFINAVKRAKLSVVGVDLQAFALLRALVPTSFLDQEPADRATAIANIASDVTNLVVDVAGEPQFTRIIAFGGNDFTKAVQDLQGIPFNEAEELKARTGLPETSMHHDEGYAGPEEPTIIIPSGEAAPGEAAEGGARPEEAVPGEAAPQGAMPPEVAPAGGGPEEPGATPWPTGPSPEAETEQESLANLQRTLEATAEALADEIRRSLDYYMSQEQSVPITRLIISGGGAMLRNLEKHLSQVFPFTVEIGNPMLRITQNKSSLTDEELKVLAPKLTIAIGLALEDEG
jgi:type IV pilus assembly protein PilM